MKDLIQSLVIFLYAIIMIYVGTINIAAGFIMLLILFIVGGILTCYALYPMYKDLKVDVIKKN